MAAHYAEFGYEKGCLIANLAAEMSDNTPLLRQAIGQSLERWTSQVASTLHEGQLDGSIVPTLDAENGAVSYQQLGGGGGAYENRPLPPAAGGFLRRGVPAVAHSSRRAIISFQPYAAILYLCPAPSRADVVGPSTPLPIK
ncbi:TetR family transcriptional regulator C-terminal domain-containing protein [Acerihabitans sp. KWT182]|uniref:TetR family transcriptional regulator C-terminal domain-containing protein n=1 Tax=Acerihabitans sp. KWT182 TaxID=3157919 RepID=A0AAU7Q4N4_9GAMM